MKLLCWTEVFWPSIGGVELFCAGLISDLKKKGHQVTVMTAHRNTDLADEDSYQGIPVLRLPLYEAIAANDVMRIIRMRSLVENEIKRQKPDLIHLNLIGPGAFLFLGDAAAELPMVISLHGELTTLHHGGNDTAFGKVLNNAKWITACSQDILDQAVSLVSQIKSKSSVIHYGVEKPDAKPSSLPFSPPRIATLGRLVKDKGIDIAIDMVTSLLPKFPDLELVIGGDGPERQVLEKKVKQSGLQKQVRFAGWVEPDDVPDFFNRSTLLLMPSRIEGLGIVTLEAAWMRRPVVSTRAAGLGEAVQDGITGFTVPDADPDQLAAKVEVLLRNPSMAIKMGEAGRLRAENQFSWDRCLSDFENLFTRIITEKSNGL